MADLKLAVVLQAIDKMTQPIRAIMQNSSAMAREFQQTRERLKGLQAQQRDIQSFRDMHAAAERNSQAMRENRERLRALSQQMAATTTPSRALVAEYQRAMREGHALKQTYREQQQALQAIRKKLKEAGVDTRNLAEHERQLREQIEETNRALGRQEGNLKKAAEQQKRMAKAREALSKAKEFSGNMAANGAMAGAAGTAGLSLMAHDALSIQKMGAKVAAQFGQTAEQAKGYREVINNVFSSGNGNDLEQVADSLSAVSSAFGNLDKLKGGQLEALTSQAIALSNAFNIDVNEAVQAASILLENGLAKNATEAFDLMTSGMQKVSVSMRQELPEILHEYSTHFRAMGFNGAEAMNLLVAAAEQGKFALDKTGDAIKEFSIRGSDGSKSSTEAYQAIKLNADKMSSAIAKGGSEARAALTKTVKGLLAIKDPATRAQTAIALFGTPIEDLSVDQIPAFLKSLINVENKIGTVAGATDRMSDALGDNAGSALERLQRLASGQLTQVLDQFGTSIVGIVNRMTEWVRQNPELSSTITKIVLGLTALVAVGGMLTVMLASLIGPFAMLKFAMASIGIASGVAFGPVLLAVAAVSAAGYLLYQNWAQVSDYMSQLWQRFKTDPIGALASVAQTIMNFNPLAAVYQAFAGVMSYLGIELPSTFTGFGQMIIQGLINGITSAAGAIKDAVVSAGQSAIGFFKETLGIHSPSRVFAELGGYTMQGLEQGLSQGVSGPLKQIQDNAKQLTTAGILNLPALSQPPVTFDNRPPLTAKQAVGQTGPANQMGGYGQQPISIVNHFTITPAPGMNEKDLAQAIARQMEQVMRNQQARTRSRLMDLE